MTFEIEKSDSCAIWHTADEIDHIRKLGTGAFSTIKADRKQLLLGYKAALKNRRIWERLDRHEIEEAVEHELQIMEDNNGR